MGSLRLVGSFKFKVSFAQEPYKRDSILQQKPMILRSLLIVDIPYVLCNVSKDASIHSCNFRQVSRWMRPMTTHGGDKTSNIWISRSIGYLLSDGDSIYSTENRLECWGLPWKRVWYVWGLPWKPVEYFCSRIYFWYDLVRLWPMLCLKCIYWDTNVFVGLMSNTGIPMDASYVVPKRCLHCPSYVVSDSIQGTSSWVMITYPVYYASIGIPS